MAESQDINWADVFRTSATHPKRAVYNDTSGLWYRLGEHQIVADGVEAMSYAEAFEKLYGDVKQARLR